MKTKDVTITKKDYVAYDNTVHKAKYNLTGKEIKLVLIAYSKVLKTDTSLKMYQFNASDLAKKLGIKYEHGRADELKRLCKSVLRKPLEIIIPRESWKIVSWFSYAKYDAKSETVTIGLLDDIKEYFIDLEKEITFIKLEKALQMTGKYSLRLYQLLMRWYSKIKKCGKWDVKIKISYLKSIFMLKPKKATKVITRDIINPAVNEINSVDARIKVTPTTKKVGREIVAYVFTVEQIRKESNTRNVTPPESTLQTDIDKLSKKDKELFDKILKEIQEQGDLFNNQGFVNSWLLEQSQIGEALKRLKEIKKRKRAKNENE